MINMKKIITLLVFLLIAPIIVLADEPRVLTLENCLEFINEDELVEITPSHIRLRKKILDTVERKKFDAKKRSENAE